MATWCTSTALRPGVLRAPISRRLSEDNGSLSAETEGKDLLILHPYLMPDSGSFRPARWPRALQRDLPARFMRYLEHRGIQKTGRKLGPSSATAMDEPSRSPGCRSRARRLDN